MPSIAGHFFEKDGKCSCGKRFADIASARQENVNQSGWAHSGNLSLSEYEQIDSERNRIFALVYSAAMGGHSIPDAVEVPAAYGDSYLGEMC